MEEYELLQLISKSENLLRRHYARNSGKSQQERRLENRMLALLQMKNDVSQNQLAFMLDIKPSLLSGLLQKLELKGYVDLEYADHVRSDMMIHLTEEGRLVEVRCETSNPFEEVMPPEEMSRLANSLELLNRYLETVLDDETFEVQMEERRGPRRRGPHTRRERSAEDKNDQHQDTHHRPHVGYTIR